MYSRYFLESRRPSETNTHALSRDRKEEVRVSSSDEDSFPLIPVSGQWSRTSGWGFMWGQRRNLEATPSTYHLRYTEGLESPYEPLVKVHRVFSSHSHTAVSSRPLQFRRRTSQDSGGVVTPLMRTTIISGQGISLP